MKSFLKEMVFALELFGYVICLAFALTFAVIKGAFSREDKDW